MKGGVLEVLLVNAEGLKDPRVLGSSNQYVVIECGSQTCTSKISKGKQERDWWNEKFSFKLSSIQCKELDQIKLRIMERDKFREDCFIGEAMVHLKGVLREGFLRGSIELMPAPYNVVLKDGRYHGELKVALKFISQVEIEQQIERMGYGVPEKQHQSLYRTILNLALKKIPWSRFFFPKHSSLAGKRKDK